MSADLIFVMAGAVAVAGFARWGGWPAPLVVTGVALLVSFLPFVPNIEIDGELLLTATLPPLLYSAALDASFTSFKQALPHVRRLGVGLVAVNAAVIGFVAYHLMPEIGVPGALLLGAIVGPPDAVSAAAIGRKLGLPRRVMTVLSGESLINDATSLTIVRVFAAIAAGATVTVWQGLGEFVLAVGVGVAIGLVFGVVLHQLRTHLDDPTVTGTLSLLMPFGAYILAEHLHGSGVLAVVAMGFYVGYHSPRTSYSQRQHDKPLWHSVDFILESFVFAYVGLQLPQVISTVTSTRGADTLVLAGVVLLVVIVLRPIFVFAAYEWGQFWQRIKLRRWKHAVEAYHADPASRAARPVAAAKRRRARLPAAPTKQAIRRRVLEPPLSWQERLVVSWSGMRGVVTLALAVALPDLTDHAMRGGHIDDLVAVAYIVTVGTLLLQGLTLPLLIKGLKVTSKADVAADNREIARMRMMAGEAGIEYLREQQQAWIDKYGVEAVETFNRFSRGLLRIEKGADQGERDLDSVTEKIAVGGIGGLTYDELHELSRGWLAVRRRVAFEQSRAGNLSEEVMREVFDAIDAEELVLDTKGSLRKE